MSNERYPRGTGPDDWSQAARMGGKEAEDKQTSKRAKEEADKLNKAAAERKLGEPLKDPRKY